MALLGAKGLGAPLPCVADAILPPGAPRPGDRDRHCGFRPHAAARRDLDVVAAAQDLGASPPAVADPVGSPAVPEPRLMQFNPDHANSVRLTGVVMEQPDLIQRHDGGALANVTLGLIAGGRVERIHVVFWDEHCEQVAGHVKQGTQLAVTGRLYEFDKRVKVNVDDFYVVDSATGLAPDEVQRVLRDNEVVLQDPTPSMLECFDLYHSARMSAPDIAKRRRIKESTVLGYIGECGAAGMPVEWGRLCVDARLGPDSSAMMTPDDVSRAVDGCREGGKQVQNLMGETRRVRMVMAQDPLTSTKLQGQENVMKGSGVTHAQIKIVLAMMIQGHGPQQWNEWISVQANKGQAVASEKGIAVH